MIRLRTIWFVIMISLFLLSAIAYGEITWTTKRLTWTTRESENPEIAVDGPNIYVVWQDNAPGNYEIYLKQSHNEGVTWTTKRLTWTSSFTSEYPAIAVEGSNIFVVWDEQLSDYEIYLKQSDDGGVTWTRQGLTWRDSYSMTPDVAVNGSKIYVVWRESTLSHIEWAIYLKQSDDGGVTWVYKNLSGFGHLEAPKISVDGSNVYVVWQVSYGYSGGIYFRKSSDGGATWGTVQTLGGASLGICCELEMAVDGPNIYVVGSGYTAQGNYDIFLLKSIDGGTTWETEKRLTHTASDSHKPAIAVNGQNIYVVWEEDRPENSEIYFTQSTDGGVTWETEKRLTWTAYGSIAPKIAVESSNIYVVWQDATPGNWEIFFKKGVLY